MVRAVLEGIAASIAWLVSAVEADTGRPLKRLSVDGGLSRSQRLMQAQSDLAQLRIDVYPTPDATAMGIAAFTRHGMGDRDGAVRAVTGWTPAASYEPRIGPTEAAERRARWHRAVDAALASSDVDG
jgi:glycerol kinase